MRLFGREIKAVTFDMDGTLYNSGRLFLRLLPDILKHRKFIVAYYRIREELRSEGFKGDIRGEVLIRLSKKLMIDESECEYMIDETIYRLFASKINRGLLYKGLREFIDMLKKNDVRLGIISDFPIDEKLMRLGLYFEPWRALINTEDIGTLKPAKEPFLKAAELLEVDPGLILHIGDRENLDVLGAKRSGFLSARLKRFGNLKSQADIVFRSYTEFLY
ncbi:MAG: HAD family hydrolase [Deltaproteobacteria bacterium]|nr:HAD family hydrolase [Deltaproteobacteria bacterium]